MIGTRSSWGGVFSFLFDESFGEFFGELPLLDSLEETEGGLDEGEEE